MIVVSGTPGESAAGLELILHPERRARLDPAAAERLIEAHWRPTPRVEAGKLLADSNLVTAMIDVSDGIAGDLGHVLDASAVGATLDAIALPVGHELAALANAAGVDPLELVLHGGEAYELLFTCRPEAAGEATAALAGIGLPARAIGRIDPERGLRLRRPGGQLEQIAAAAHDHFRSEGRTR